MENEILFVSKGLATAIGWESKTGTRSFNITFLETVHFVSKWTWEPQILPAQRGQFWAISIWVHWGALSQPLSLSWSPSEWVAGQFGPEPARALHPSVVPGQDLDPPARRLSLLCGRAMKGPCHPLVGAVGEGQATKAPRDPGCECAAVITFGDPLVSTRQTQTRSGCWQNKNKRCPCFRNIMISFIGTGPGGPGWKPQLRS